MENRSPNKYDILLQAFRVVTMNGERPSLEMADEVERALKYAADKRHEECQPMRMPAYR